VAIIGAHRIEDADQKERRSIVGGANPVVLRFIPSAYLTRFSPAGARLFYDFVTSVEGQGPIYRRGLLKLSFGASKRAFRE